MTRVCHISPVHHVEDNRVFHKECAALRDAGYEVFLVIQSEVGDEVRDGIRVVALSRPATRFARLLFSSWEALLKALRLKADVYHFHDPEFVPQALLMRMMGKRVVYDIHEDYVTSMYQKPYLPRWMGYLLGRLTALTEGVVSRCFHTVIAERYYADRFSHATRVLNYPRMPTEPPAPRRSETQLLYTGKIMFDRGAGVHAELPGIVEGIRVCLVGYCPTAVHQEILASAPLPEALEFPFVGSFVPFHEIVSAYRSRAWLAGLAIFPKTEHYRQKELTKLFEYMQYGIPIIASDFPTWVDLVEGNGCGLCVDPQNPEQIAAAINSLRHDPDRWQAMSAAGLKAATAYTWESQSKNLVELYRQIAPPDQP